MKNTITFCSIVFFTVTGLTSAQHSARLIFSHPSPCIGLWETTPHMTILHLTTDAGTPAVRGRFYLTLPHERYGELAYGESNDKDLAADPITQTFLSSQIINWHELRYEGEMADPVYRRSSRLDQPVRGSGQRRVDALQAENDHPSLFPK
jgi:hypothetical protein